MPMGSTETQSTHWAEVEALFQLLADTEPAHRAQRLGELARDFAPEAVREVEGLLGSLERHESLFDAPAAEQLALEREYQPGTRLGRWEVLGTLGRGGQGLILQVARVEGGFRQRGVLKTLRQASTTPDALRRLLRERQLLAELEHRGLPAVLDGGVLDDGAPYFVLEFINGEPIDLHARRHQLDTAARVALLRQVAAVVAHAHSRLVLHRDLKPANVLVEAEGRVVLLDFGVAQPLDAERTHTIAGFTPAYAAPEQVRSERNTVATDVYGLAATGFALLCGRSPFADVQEAGIDAVLNRTPNFPDTLDPDLAAILAKALRKEPESRYASADAFDADLARWQAGEPVLARAGGRRYRAGKWLRRHRLAVGAAAALLLSLGIGLGAALIQRQEALRQSEAARSAREQAESTLAVLVDLFVSSGGSGLRSDLRERRLTASGRRGPELTVREVLDEAAEQRLPELDPAIRLPLHAAFAEVYASLGLSEAAMAQFRAALAVDPTNPQARFGLTRQLLLQPVLGDEALERLSELLDEPGAFPALELEGLVERAANALRGTNRPGEAAHWLQRALARHAGAETAAPDELAARLGADGSVGLAHLWVQRARLALEPDAGAAEADLLRAQALIEAAVGPDSGGLIRVLETLADLRGRQGRPEEAIAALERSAQILARVDPDNPVYRVRIALNLGVAHRRLGDIASARSAYQDGLRIWEAAGRPRAHGTPLTLRRGLANLLMDEGRYAEAAAAYREVLTEGPAILGAGHAMFPAARASLARALYASGDSEEAEVQLLALLEITPAILPEMRVTPGLGLMTIALDRADATAAQAWQDWIDAQEAPARDAWADGIALARLRLDALLGRDRGEASQTDLAIICPLQQNPPTHLDPWLPAAALSAAGRRCANRAAGD